MSISVQVRNYRGVESADIDIDTIALIQGPNKSGKSSVVWSLRSTLLGQATPDPQNLPDAWLKADLADVVRGAGPSVCNVFGENDKGQRWSAKMNWPGGEHETQGQAPVLSETAAGIWNAGLMHMKQNDRAAALASMLIRDVRIEDFKASIEADEETVEKVHKVVSEAGFEAALTRAQGQQTALRALWEQATGVNFGSSLMVDWRPAAWTKELEATTEELANAALEATLQVEREAATGAAVSASEIARLTALAGRRETLERQHDAAVADEETAKSALEKARADRDALPSAAQDAVDCPHCKKPLAILAGKIVKGEKGKLDAAELKKRRLDIAGGDGKVQNLGAAYERAMRATATAKADLESADKAAHSLQEIQEKTSDTDAIARARGLVQIAQSNLNMVRQVASAEALSARLKVTLSIIGALKPEGIRQTIMAREIEAFNKRLLEISQQFGIGAVRFDDRFNLVCGEYLYRNEAGSERFRAQIVLQVAIAELDGSPMVIIDSDVDMDRDWYGRLVGMLLKRQMPAVISIRSDTFEKAFNPRMEEVRKFVRAYWVDRDGVVRFLEKPQEKAA